MRGWEASLPPSLPPSLYNPVPVTAVAFVVGGPTPLRLPSSSRAQYSSAAAAASVAASGVMGEGEGEFPVVVAADPIQQQ